MSEQGYVITITDDDRESIIQRLLDIQKKLQEKEKKQEEQFPPVTNNTKNKQT